jgi:hypothetical protein
VVGRNMWRGSREAGEGRITPLVRRNALRGLREAAAAPA